MDKIDFHNQRQQEFFKRFIQYTMGYYGDRLISLAVYGSYARNEARLNSDLDLFVVLSDNPSLSRSERNWEFLTKVEKPFDTERLSLESDLISMEISALILPESKARSFNPLYLDMVTEVHILWDPRHFLKERLNKTAEQMKRWKSKKILLGGKWAWDITPNRTWGERIEYE